MIVIRFIGGVHQGFQSAKRSGFNSKASRDPSHLETEVLRIKGIEVPTHSAAFTVNRLARSGERIERGKTPIRVQSPIPRAKEKARTHFFW
jgi:hypothetical protein